MTTAEAIQALLDAATTEGKSPAEVIELYRALHQQRATAKLEQELLNLPTADAQTWARLRLSFQQRRQRDIAPPREWLVRIAAAIRGDDQAGFWRAVVGLALAARIHSPWLISERLWEGQDGPSVT